MQKLTKIIIKMLTVIMIIIIMLPAINADILNPSGVVPSGTTVDNTTSQAISRAWDVIRTVLQIASVGALLFSGVRYMFASADQKADLKKTLGPIIIGIVIVFGATIFVEIILNIAGDIFPTLNNPVP